MKILKIIAKWWLLLVAVVIIVFAALWVLNAPQKLSNNSESLTRLSRADFTVETMSLSIVDNKRATPAMGGYDGDDKRTLKGTVWFPKGKSIDHPLIIFSHGFGSYHQGCRHIAQYLARNGYMVAAVNFPLSNMFSPADVPQLLDVVNQPGDVSAVIDHMLALNNDPTNAIHQRIDATKIGAMGLSLGGLTTALATFHPDLKDARIQAAVMMAPPLEAFSDEFYASNPNVNALVISGTMDRIVPEQENATQVMPRQPNGWFASLDKGTHLGFANVGNPIRWMNNPDDLGCTFMNLMLAKLDLPERWNVIIPNTGNVLRDVVAAQPCPVLDGESMNGLKQQWLTRLTVGSFFDMHLRSGDRAEQAGNFFTQTLSTENSEVRLTMPR